jgi:hypothetical protein
MRGLTNCTCLHRPARHCACGAGSGDKSRFSRLRWCCRRGLNSRPLPYQGSALPLSYGSSTMLAAHHGERSTTRGQCLDYRMDARNRSRASDTRAPHHFLPCRGRRHCRRRNRSLRSILHRRGGARKVAQKALGSMTHPIKSDKSLQAAKLQAPKPSAQEQRRARLAAELRSNLLKRKEQARGRAHRDVADGAGEAGNPEIGKAQIGQPGKVARRAP